MFVGWQLKINLLEKELEGILLHSFFYQKVTINIKFLSQPLHIVTGC